MAKTAIEFLQQLAQRELAPPGIIASLRRQVGDTIRPISAAAIARLLVDKGHLTAAQAEQLLGAPLAAVKGPPPQSLAETKSMDSDLGLMPLEEIPPPAAPLPKPAAKTSPPAEAAAALEPLDLGLADLLPLEEPLRSASAPSAATRPVAKRTTPAKLPKATPLESLSPLTPLDAISPLADPLAAMPGPATALPKPPPAAARPDTLAAPAASPTRGSTARRWWIGGITAIVAIAALGGGIAVVIMRGESGPDPFELAEQDYQSGRFAAAAEKFDALLATTPRHERAGLARVRRGMAQMLAAKGSGNNWPAVLPVAEQALAQIGGEETLLQAQNDLAPLLIELADGLIQRAEETADDAVQRLDEARRALALADNGRYVPGALRDWQRLARISESLAVLERRQQARQALGQFATVAKELQATGKFSAIVAEQHKLLVKHPQLAGDSQLAAVSAQAATIAMAAITPLSELPQPQTSETERPAEVMSAGASAPIYVARAGDVLWALDAESGKPLWRRQTGSRWDAVTIPASDALLAIDGDAHEILCLDRQSGALQWRIALGAPVAGPPLLIAGHIFVTSTAGRVFRIDPNSGMVSAGCQLPLPAACGAAVTDDGRQLVQPSAHDYVFVLSADELKGQAAAFLGHASHGLQTPPLILRGRLLVAECRGLDRTVLHTMALDNHGLPSDKCQRLDLTGQILTPPAVFGDRLFVVTDRGTTRVFQVPEDGDAPLKILAEMPMESRATQLHFGAMAGNHLCIAGLQLALFQLSADGRSLTTKWSRYAGDSFSSPAEPLGAALLAVRHSPERGFVATAVKTADGQPIWETPLAWPQEGAR